MSDYRNDTQVKEQIKAQLQQDQSQGAIAKLQPEILSLKEQRDNYIHALTKIQKRIDMLQQDELFAEKLDVYIRLDYTD